MIIFEKMDNRLVQDEDEEEKMHVHTCMQARIPK